MKVVLNPGPQKIDTKRKILYGVILAICLIAILISAYILVFRNNGELGRSEYIPASEEEYLQREAEFETMFSNKIINQINQNILITNKMKRQDDIIGIAYENSEKIAGKYSLDIKIPYININTAAVKQYNNEIEQIFKQ